MTEDELALWELYEAARKKLILFYLPVVDGLARYIARSTGRANWEDLRQDGAIGLMNAITRFDPSRGVPFEAFARLYIRGAIFDSPEITRAMTRRQEEIYRKMRRAEDALTKALQRNPTIDEIAEKTRLTTEQIQNALAARGVAYAEDFLDGDDDLSSSGQFELPRPDSLILIEEALDHLAETEQAIVRLHYLEDMSHEKIAETLGIIPFEVTEIRERAIGKVAKTCQRAMRKLRKQFDVKVKGGYDEDRRSGK